MGNSLFRLWNQTSCGERRREWASGIGIEEGKEREEIGRWAEGNGDKDEEDYRELNRGKEKKENEMKEGKRSNESKRRSK